MRKQGRETEENGGENGKARNKIQSFQLQHVQQLPWTVCFQMVQGLSPGPMALVSGFSSNQDSTEHKSFSQLLAGAMASPGARLPYNATDSSFMEVSFKDGGEKGSGFKENRPLDYGVANSALFTVLNSYGLHQN